MRATYPAAVYLCLRDDRGRVLLLRRAGTGYRDGELALPAGHIEPGESATAALLRETREELGLDLPADAVRMVLVQHGIADGLAYVDFVFAAVLARGMRPRIAEPDKASELLWAPLDELPADVVPVIRNALEALARGETYTEYGWGDA
ncbi:NUDIX domain-containing protein [Leifsonia sp. F6_8S_P_1B]|uniref:NUDIX domain-containing protein n=1 Tax=Leifsonia williamsii TaxID=3035919 RepID=A0ABT8KDV4_9MICO|nr:NUDIX domain-containing protein [Leifsonia williamsii]MDN4615357.1 NUDIX domain-containing protein [Leifsonia williamsii]